MVAQNWYAHQTKEDYFGTFNRYAGTNLNTVTMHTWHALLKINTAKQMKLFTIARNMQTSNYSIHSTISTPVHALSQWCWYIEKPLECACSTEKSCYDCSRSKYTETFASRTVLHQVWIPVAHNMIASIPSIIMIKVKKCITINRALGQQSQLEACENTLSHRWSSPVKISTCPMPLRTNEGGGGRKGKDGIVPGTVKERERQREAGDRMIYCSLFTAVNIIRRLKTLLCGIPNEGMHYRHPSITHPFSVWENHNGCVSLPEKV